MPRLNVYLPDDVYRLANKWRESANLSEICARAIRDELEAQEAHRTARALLETLRPPSGLERELAGRYHLKEALVLEAAPAQGQLREGLGELAAGYLDRNISDGSLLAIGGGRQMWCMVRNLQPRRVRATITALGLGQADPQLLHVHPNTLTTLVWLLYGPRSAAHVIGAAAPALWSEALPPMDHPSYFVVASCSRLDAASPFARLLGADAVARLAAKRVAGDFAYVFLDAAGKVVPLPATAAQFTLPATLLKALSKRTDARTLLVAGGPEKRAVIALALKAGLCNSLVTDSETARHLMAARGATAP